MNIGFDTLLSLLGVFNVLPRKDDATYWSGWVEEDGAKRDLKVTEAALSESGIELTFTDGTDEHNLVGVPKDLHHTLVIFDGVPVESAAMIFGFKGALNDLTRFGFDFRPVPLHGNQARFNMRYDP